MVLTIRKGTRADLEAFICLLSGVRETMTQKDWFILDPPETIREMMDEGILEFWVALDGSRMAGGLSIVHPGERECNYGYDLGYDRERLLKVVNMDSAAVHPDYRGQGIQGRLLEAAETALREQGARYLLCTIHPENRFSLNNALKQGYTIEKTGQKYGSVRHFLCKKIF